MKLWSHDSLVAMLRAHGWIVWDGRGEGSSWASKAPLSYAGPLVNFEPFTPGSTFQDAINPAYRDEVEAVGRLG